MGTLSIPWVAGGRPFQVTQQSFTPSDLKEGLLAKSEAVKRAAQGLDDVPKETRDELLKDAVTIGHVAMITAIVHSFLCRIDPALRALGAEKVREQLSMDEMQAFLVALKPVAKQDGRPLAAP